MEAIQESKLAGEQLFTFSRTLEQKIRMTTLEFLEEHFEGASQKSKAVGLNLSMLHSPFEIFARE